MTNELDYATLSSALAPLVEAQQAMAMRPQKSRVVTTSTPYALEDLLTLRTMIGPETARLDRALKNRENFGYSFANALSSIPQQQGPGSWVSALARGLGAGYTGRTNAEIDRAQQAYDAKMKDITTRMAIDKAMGDKQTQDIRYDEMPWGGNSSSKRTGVGGPDQVVQNIATATGEGMDPEEFIKQYNTGGFIESGASDVDARDNPTLAARFIRSAIAPINTGARSALAQNMTDKIIAPKIQNMVQNMGGAKGGDTLREVYARIGPLAQITSLGTQEQLGAISAAKTDVLDIINRDRRAVGMQPLTMEQFQPAWNRLFTGIATYHKQYGEKESNKKEKQTVTQPVESQEDYSKYGF